MLNPSTIQRQGSDRHWSPSICHERLKIDYLTNLLTLGALADGEDVIAGLTTFPKALPPKYFYDDRGSELFEQITELPEYYLTRTETAILKASAGDIAQIVGACDLIELGSGSSTKTRYLLDAFAQARLPVRYCPVDVSGGMLEATAHQLLQEYSALTIHGLVGTYTPALANLPETTLPTKMIAFIGSTLGNLTPAECHGLLTHISDALNPGDYFLLGVDLEKAPGILERAYNDSQGVTADFNLNMLHHLNWRFQGNFQVEQFSHVAFYNPTDRQIEIYIESLNTQTVNLGKLNLEVKFDRNERLLSEISRKFSLPSLAQELAAVGLQHVHTFTDEQQWFGLLLCQRQ